LSAATHTAALASIPLRIAPKRSSATSPRSGRARERRFGPPHAPEQPRHAKRGAGRARRDRRPGVRAVEQLADVVVGDEAGGVRAREDYALHIGSRRASDELIERVHDRHVHQRMRRV